MKSNLFLFLFLFFVGCAGKETNQPFRATSMDVPFIDEKSLGNMRIALIGPTKSYSIVLVNQSNQLYLSPLEKTSTPLSKLPLEDLKYEASFLSPQQQTRVSILEDSMIAQLEGMLQKLSFYSIATPCTLAEVSKKEWPVRDTILVEKEHRLYIFTREEHLVDAARRRTSKGQLYLTIKNNILLAQRHGYHPMYFEQKVFSSQE